MSMVDVMMLFDTNRSVFLLLVVPCALACSEDAIQNPDTRRQLVEFAARVIKAASAGTLPQIGVK